MPKKQDPPGYPGDEAITKYFDEALRELFREKGLSPEEAEALIKQSMHEDPHSQVPRALALVTRRLREEKKMSRKQVSTASGLPLSFINSVERGRAQGITVTEVVRLAMGLNHPLDDFVAQVSELEQKLKSK